MATNYEIFSGLPELSYTQALRWGQYMLEQGENWGNVWTAIKERFPSIPDENIDTSLNKEFWYQEGAYDQYTAEQERIAAERDPNAPPAWNQDSINWDYQMRLTADPESYNTPGKKEALKYEIFWQHGIMPTDVSQIPVEQREIPQDVQTKLESIDVPEPANPAAPANAGALLDDAMTQMMMEAHWGTNPDEVNESQLSYWRDMPYDDASRIMIDTATARAKREDEAATKAEQERIAKIENQGKIIDAGPAGWYFPQKDVLLRFVDGDPTPEDDSSDSRTVWLYSQDNNTAIPFLSAEAFTNYFNGEKTLEDAINNGEINQLSPALLMDQTSPFYKANLLNAQNGIRPDGTIPESGQILWSYGAKTSDKRDDISMTWTENFLDLLSRDENIGITKATMEEVMASDSEKQKLATAVFYGGYGYPDIYRYLRAKELVKQGYTQYEDFVAFDPTMEAQEWYATEEGQKALSDEVFTIPQKIGGVDTAMLANAFMFEDTGYFDAPLAFMEYGSDEWEAEVDKIDSQFYDIALAQIGAETERAKAIADDNWRILKESVEDRYDIELSNNAIEAWDQVKAIRENYAQRGISNTGLEEGARDDMLHKVRRADELMREQEDDDLEVEERNYYLNSGSEQEIYDLIKNRPEDAERWGLIPNAEMIKHFSLDAIKARYEGISDEDAKQLQDTFLVYYDDGTVGYRSVLYQNENRAAYSKEQEKRVYQEGELMRRRDEERARAEEDFDATSLEGYDKTPTDESTALLLDTPPAPYEKQGVHIADPADLPKYRDKLIAAGIPESEWNKYIKKIDGQGDKLFWFDPAATGNKAADVDQPIPEAGKLAYDPSISGNQFYNVNGDLFNAATGAKIGFNDWNANWTGRATEVTAPATNKIAEAEPMSELKKLSIKWGQDSMRDNRVDPGEVIQPNDNLTKTFYRQGPKDIYDANTKTKIGFTDWGKNWDGKSTEVSAPSTNLVTKPTTSSFLSATTPKKKNQELKKYTATFSKTPAPSDSRFWSMNPDREENLKKFNAGTLV